jgi:hypothetical protein
MNNTTIGILFGLGFGAWIYSKVYRSTGGNSKSAILVAGGAGLVAFLLIVTLLGIIFKD